MPTGRLTDLGTYKGVLPYSSELFGIYQPMIGWHATRRKRWLERQDDRIGVVDRLAPCFRSAVQVQVRADDCELQAENLGASPFDGTRPRTHRSVLLTQLTAMLRKLGHETKPPDHSDGTWEQVVDPVDKMLQTTVIRVYNDRSMTFCSSPELRELQRDRATAERVRREHALQMQRGLEYECEVGGVILELAKERRYDLLEQVFYASPRYEGSRRFRSILEYLKHGDPLESFDPSGDLRSVTVSPIGITHLFRQYFFELDTFLGSPVAHLYVPPGSTSEIIEVSTRRTYVERTIEQTTETSRKEETSTTEEDELSDAVKQENKQDMKLGVSSTVEQSWGTGNISATASINLDRSQTAARDSTHKRMRQQSSKLSSEIRQNYKTTFKTTTETVDTLSKRYVITNPTNEMVNYELRRKMRQVVVQVQDVGTYLCWDTFVDEPGMDVGLANLVHVARPADLLPRPADLTLADLLPVDIPFTANGVWNFNERKGNEGDQFVQIGSAPIPPGPAGYDLVVSPNNELVWLSQISATGDGFHQVWAYAGRFRGTNIEIGVWTKPTGIGWDERVDFVLQGSVKYAPSDSKRAEIEAARATRGRDQQAVDAENNRLTKAAFFTSARERIEQASNVTRRKYEDLRDEERIIVYRRLIRSLMTSSKYDAEVEEGETDRGRHVLSQLINTIFDVDKMLYFVAPEWWKPRERARLGMGYNEMAQLTPEALVTWDDGLQRDSNYLITDKSAPAAKGSSLGWLLQLDGDDLRNAFLNAPWVKAVIPVRPGREKAAINWLKNARVEGGDGLGASYAADAEEREAVRTALGLPSEQDVTLDDAIQYLCQEVSAKHAEANTTRRFPPDQVDDSSTVLATPVEKVYEHGFYPLQGGFRIDPSDPGGDPNNQARNFQVFDQWIEILPTDQVVPIAVQYDPATGRLKVD